MDAEEVLPGGVANPGAVVRVGDTVRRPRKPQTDSVHHFLKFLVSHGLDGAVPTPLGFDDDNREILTYLVGEIALPPHIAWMAGDDLLVSVAELQHGMHDVARGYRPPASAVWDDDVAPGYLPANARGSLVCHNDLCVENVVIRQGRAVAFIDFDYAAPVDPLFDIAVAVRHWAPIRSPEDLAAVEVDVDAVARFRAFLEVHRLGHIEREGVVELLARFLDQAHANVQRLARDGNIGFAEMIDAGYLDQNRRSRQWLGVNATGLAK